jgi:hypothetical protein
MMIIDAGVSQGRFNVRRDLSGRIRIEQPPVVLVPPSVAIEMAVAILRTAGGHVEFADEGQTVIRAPTNGNGGLRR